MINRQLPNKQQKKQCSFCTTNTKWIDYKNTELLNKFTSMQFKIMPTNRTGTCAKHQRELAKAIKKARFMSLLPFTITGKEK